MKLLTAVIAADRLRTVTAALDSAGLMVTTIASAEAPGVTGGATLSRRGMQYQDTRCIRLEVLVSDADAEVALGLLALEGGTAASGLVWSAEVDGVAIPAAPKRPATSPEMAAVRR
ncbi:MAG: P-II family nitrogen regulator [Acidimicrobiales bacterium]